MDSAELEVNMGAGVPDEATGAGVAGTESAGDPEDGAAAAPSDGLA